MPHHSHLQAPTRRRIVVHVCLQAVVAEVGQVQTVPVHGVVVLVLDGVEHRRVAYAPAACPLRLHVSVVAVAEVVCDRNVEVELLLLEGITSLYACLHLLVGSEVVLRLHVEQVRQTASVAVAELQRVQYRTDVECSALVPTYVAPDASHQCLADVRKQLSVEYAPMRFAR